MKNNKMLVTAYSLQPVANNDWFVSGKCGVGGRGIKGNCC